MTDYFINVQMHQTTVIPHVTLINCNGVIQTITARVMSTSEGESLSTATRASLSVTWRNMLLMWRYGIL